MKVQFLSVGLVLSSLGTLAYADHEGGEKKALWHCEKTDESGKETEIEAKDKNDCKKKGGKWSKAHAGHDKNEGHEHK